MSATASQPPVLPTLDSQPLPRRVREVLKATLKIATDELERGMSEAIRDFEQQLYRQADSIDPVVSGRSRRTIEVLDRTRADLALNVLNALEAELANLHDPQIVHGQLQTRYRAGDELALVNDLEIEETGALTDASTRAELQNSLQLFLLGQRFGVLAGRPAFGIESLPVGPQALCRSVRWAVESAGLEVDFRLMFYRAFERQVMQGHGNLVEAVNDELARKGVLPSLQYVPVRARRTEQKAGGGGATGIGDHGLSIEDISQQQTARGDLRNRSGGARAAGAAASGQGAQQAADLLLAMASGQGDVDVEQGFNLLRQLMGSRRQLLGKLNPDRSRDSREPPRLVSASDLQEALRNLQHRPQAPVLSHGRSTARNVGHLKQDMLAMLRRVSPNQEAPALADEHNDAIDLVAMLFDNLGKDVKPGSTTSSLLAKLQVPLMRVALQDSAFFIQPEHPARRMLSTIAETGANWLGDDESDGGLAPQVHSIIDRAVHEYKDDPDIFKHVLQELLTHIQNLTRKAEVAERRHVEAARGKEKLTLAREHATQSIAAVVKNQKLPRFTKTMLSQAWTDVMALTALRHGEDSPLWHRQLQIAERLIQIAQQPAGEHADTLDADKRLQREIEEGLAKVGYQGEDITAIAERLVHPDRASKDETSSRTELTMRLKAQARLGEELPNSRGRRIPLSAEERVQLQRVEQASVGTWFEFVLNPQGDLARRRLSWLSTATGGALFVNQRGQKNAEYTLETLARLMAKGQVRIVEEDASGTLDRAWENVLNALRSFAVPDEAAGGDNP